MTAANFDEWLEDLRAQANPRGDHETQAHVREVRRLRVAHDLAQDVARLWMAKRRDIEERARLTGAKAFPLPDQFADALDRLAGRLAETPVVAQRPTREHTWPDTLADNEG